jgi:hypothetical protein
MSKLKQLIGLKSTPLPSHFDRHAGQRDHARHAALANLGHDAGRAGIDTLDSRRFLKPTGNV